jgi:excisionase family DNA binding protein
MSDLSPQSGPNQRAGGLGLSRRRIYQLIDEGKLDMVKIGKASWVPSAAVRRLAGERDPDAE